MTGINGCLEIGKIIKPHGLKGSVKVVSYLESDGMLQNLDRVIVGQRSGESTAFTVREIKPRGRCFTMRMEGVEAVEQAEAMVGSSVCVSRDMLAPLPEGEYYWQELIGIAVMTEEGFPIGRLNEIFPTGSNDVYVCGDGEREILLPAIESVVLKIDVEKGTMIVRLPEGLT